jgi:hypothetical protein
LGNTYRIGIVAYPRLQAPPVAAIVDESSMCASFVTGGARIKPSAAAR